MTGLGLPGRASSHAPFYVIHRSQHLGVAFAGAHVAGPTQEAAFGSHSAAVRARMGEGHGTFELCSSNVGPRQSNTAVPDFEHAGLRLDFIRAEGT